MRIRTKLLINIFLPLLTTLIILFIMASSMKQRNEAERENSIALSILSEMTELNQRIYYYLLYGEDRARNEAFSIFDSLAVMIKNMRFGNIEQDRTVARIRDSLAEMKAIFSERVKTDEYRALPIDPDLQKERQDRLSGQLLIRARNISSDAFHLYDISRLNRMRYSARTNTLILLLLLASLIVAVGTLIPINRTIARSLARLTAGAGIIGSGNLDHKIGLRSKDELGQLARAFDDMSSRLKATTVSRDELVKEIAERSRVEDALRRSEAILKQAGQMSHLGAWEIEYRDSNDLDENPLHWSDEVYRIFGYEPGSVEVSNDLFFQRVHPDDRRPVREAVAHAIATKTPYGIEHRIIRADGSERIVYEHAEIIFENGGRPVRVIGAVQDITERKQIEEALKQNERFLNAIIENAPACVKLVAQDGTLLKMNSAGLKMLGVNSFEEVKGHPLYPIVTPDYRKAFLNLTKEVFLGKPGTLEFEAINLKGRRLWLDTHAVPLYGNSGNITALLGITLDITERKQAEEALERRDEEFKKISRQNELILEFAGDGIFGLDVEGNVTFVNTVAAHMLGYESRELIGTHSHSTWHYRKQAGADYPSRECPIYAAYNEGVIHSGEEVFWRKDGTSFPVEYTSRPLYEDNRITGAVVTYRDITDRTRAEAELRESEERFRAAYEQAAIGIEMLDLNGWYLRGNGMLSRMLGYSDQELGGLTFIDITHPDDRRKEAQLIDQLLSREIPSYSIEKRYIHKQGGDVWCRVTSSIVRTAKPYRISIIEDITERKRGEEELRRLVSELARSNKELEQFAYVASHDLQEPLRMVASYVRLLEKKYKGSLDPQADKYINFAAEGAKRMQSLIEGLLAYSRIARRGGEFKQVDTNRVLSSALANLAAAIRESRAVIARDDLPIVRGDETQLLQLFQNLIGNATKFRKPDVPPSVNISARKERTEWIFSVRDNGIGIDSEYYNRIFLIFQRLHTVEEYPGTGIGLSLCKRIVERHRGRIWVESTPGEGSTFFFTIPAGV